MAGRSGGNPVVVWGVILLALMAVGYGVTTLVIEPAKREMSQFLTFLLEALDMFEALLDALFERAEEGRDV